MTTTVLSRRELGRAAVALCTAGAMRAYGRDRASLGTWNGYSNAVVINAMGGITGGFDHSAPADARLSPSDIRDIKESGLTAVTVTVGSVGNFPRALAATTEQIIYFEQKLSAHADVFVKVLTGADLAIAKKTKRLGVIYGFQDTWPFGSELFRLDTFFHLGLRVLQPTYNLRNLVGDGCLEKANGGLSLLGYQLVERANQLGICLDLSHGGRRTMSDVIRASKRPVAITHTGCAALVDLPRNTTDELLRAVARRGGVVGIYFMPFLRASGQVTSEDVVRHIEHALKICGEDHVGIGTDGGISGIEITPEFRRKFREFFALRREAGVAAPGEDPEAFHFVADLNSPRRLEKLARLLLDRGHSEKRVRKVLGENFQRLFTEVWPTSSDQVR
jgi:membrane dipeptidase